MASVLNKKFVDRKKNTKDKSQNIDLADVNARVAIAFALTMILAVLVFIASRLI